MESHTEVRKYGGVWVTGDMAGAGGPWFGRNQRARVTGRWTSRRASAIHSTGVLNTRFRDQGQVVKVGGRLVPAGQRASFDWCGPPRARNVTE